MYRSLQPARCLERSTGELVSRHPPEALLAIEIGAVLGNNVDRGEDGCARGRGVTASDTMISEVLRMRLIIREDALSSWSFVHALFREAVLKHAEDGGRCSAGPLACRCHPRTEDAGRTMPACSSQRVVQTRRCALQDAVLTEVSVGELGRAKVLNELRKGSWSRCGSTQWLLALAVACAPYTW